MHPSSLDPFGAAESRERQKTRLAKKAARKAAKKARRKANESARASAPKPARPARRGPRHSVYRTEEWKRLRYDVLKASNGRCCLCGASAHDGVRLNVDHINPISTHPHLALTKSNLQVLCSSCNWGKGGRDTTDWREERPDEFLIPWDRFDSF